MKNKRMLPLFTMLLAIDPAARAQSALVSSIMAGGGSQTGTIGQWSAGPMTTEPPAIKGGFWNAEEMPWLRIQRTGGSVVIAWPASFIGFQLEQSSAPGAGAAWGSVSQSVNVANGENQITLSIGPGNRFFRLHKP